MLSGLFITRDSTDIVLCESLVLFLVNGVSRTRVSPLAQHLPESHWKRSLGRKLRWPLKDIVNDALSYTYLLAMLCCTSGFYKPYCVYEAEESTHMRPALHKRSIFHLLISIPVSFCLDWSALKGLVSAGLIVCGSQPNAHSVSIHLLVLVNTICLNDILILQASCCVLKLFVFY